MLNVGKNNNGVQTILTQQEVDKLLTIYHTIGAKEAKIASGLTKQQWAKFRKFANRQQ